MGRDINVPLTLVSFIACAGSPLSAWRPVDHDAYKITRVIAGRRIAGSGWLPTPAGHIRIRNGNRHVAAGWLIDRVAALIAPVLDADPHPVLLPFPGPNRIVGAPPSGSRALAQELTARTGLRTIDILRWRQRMPSCRPLDLQAFVDNLVTTGSPIRADCILIADFISNEAALHAAALRLQQMGSEAILAVSAACVRRSHPDDPFTTEMVSIGEGTRVGV
jgi:hypothetical protein